MKKKYCYFLFLNFIFVLFFSSNVFADDEVCADCTTHSDPDSKQNVPDPSPDATKKITVVEQNQKIVNDCVQGASKTDEEISIKYRFKALCKKANPDATPPTPEINQEGDVSYKILKRSADNKIVLNLKLGLDIKTAKQDRKNQILSSTKECVKDINRYFNSYGMELNADFILPSDKAYSSADGNIIIDDDQGRSHSREYHFKGLLLPITDATTAPIVLENNQMKATMGPTQGCLWLCMKKGLGITSLETCEAMCEGVRQREYCNMMTHELGHLLGLPDEYSEPGFCPDRPPEMIAQERDPFSVMARPHDGLFDGAASELFNSIGMNASSIPSLDIGNLTQILTLPPSQSFNLPTTDAFFANRVEFMPRHISQILSPPQNAASLCTSKKID